MGWKVIKEEQRSESDWLVEYSGNLPNLSLHFLSRAVQKASRRGSGGILPCGEAAAGPQAYPRAARSSATKVGNGGQATFLDRLLKVHGSFSIFLMPAFPPAFGGFVGSGWTRFSSTVSGNSTIGR
jgi:hypothetical protein